MNPAGEPLNPEAVDALLSAELDGELVGAASELGLTVAEALTELAATPGVDARRRALTQARDLLATRSPLDPGLEDRLVGAAMARDDLAIARAKRARGARQWRALVAIGSVAAAVAVIAVVGLKSTHSNDSAKASSPIGAPLEGAKSPSAVDSPAAAPGLAHAPEFGDVTSPAALRAPALQQLAALRRRAADSANTTAPTPFANSQGAEPTTNGETDKTAAGAAAHDCTVTLRHRYGISSAPVIVGTGTVSGAAVEIVIFDNPGKPVAYVVSPGDCSLVRKQFLAG